MQISILISSILIIFGIAYAILAVKLHRRSRYLFSAVLLFETGVFLLLSSLNIIGIGFPKAWSLLPIFTGIALLIAGQYRYRVLKPNYIIMSAAFIILGIIMMIFALDLVSFSLAQFVRDWWFLLVLFTVIILALIFLGTRYDFKKQKI